MYMDHLTKKKAVGQEAVQALAEKAAADPLLIASRANNYKQTPSRPKAPEKGITIKVGEAYRTEEEAQAKD